MVTVNQINQIWRRLKFELKARRNIRRAILLVPEYGVIPQDVRMRMYAAIDARREELVALYSGR